MNLNCILILSAKLQRAFLHLIVKYVHRVYHYHPCIVHMDGSECERDGRTEKLYRRKNGRAHS